VRSDGRRDRLPRNSSERVYLQPEVPDQVFDGRAGLHHNGFRDFDPATGRYVESDPIGLTGGWKQTDTTIMTLPRPNDSAEATLSDPGAFFRTLGHLHDCEVLTLEVNTATREVIIVVDDLYANFLGLPEYPGKQRAAFLFGGVDDLDTGMSLDGLMARIMDLDVEEHSGLRTHVVVRLQPSGQIGIKCKTVACRSTRTAL